MTKQKQGDTHIVCVRLPKWCSGKNLPADAGDTRDARSVPGGKDSLD